MKRSIILAAALILSILFPKEISAASRVPFEHNKKPFGESLDSISSQINDLGPYFSYAFTIVFILMFLYGVIMLGYSIITKTGEKMKKSASVMLWVPIAFFLVRVGAVYVFTLDSLSDIFLADDIINFLRFTGYYLAIGMVLVSLCLTMYFKFVHHPEFGRWSKRLRFLAVAVIVLSTIMPVVFKGI